ncbi:hypothetical protein MIH18_22420 (plasmid) [Marinobacter sp. M3C]|nr:hypothetical protein [Marinobacter sp. M3C]UQG62681.1 hypothetical protein MIH18_22420 [Marinobacter sp. M3C]
MTDHNVDQVHELLHARTDGRLGCEAFLFQRLSHRDGHRIVAFGHHARNL